MPHEARKHLHDVLTALEAIEGYTRGLDQERFLEEDMIQAAVERKFEIVGEALNRLDRTAPELFDQVPEAARIVGFRNILAHGYDVVDPELVWDAVTNRLPELKAVVTRLLAT